MQEHTLGGEKRTLQVNHFEPCVFFSSNQLILTLILVSHSSIPSGRTQYNLVILFASALIVLPIPPFRFMITPLVILLNHPSLNLFLKFERKQQQRYKAISSRRNGKDHHNHHLCDHRHLLPRSVKIDIHTEHSNSTPSQSHLSLPEPNVFPERELFRPPPPLVPFLQNPSLHHLPLPSPHSFSLITRSIPNHH